MSIFLKLADVICFDIICSWLGLGLEHVVNLDTSFTNVKNRNEFLDILKNPLLSLSGINYEKHIAWIILRSVKISIIHFYGPSSQEFFGFDLTKFYKLDTSKVTMLAFTNLDESASFDMTRLINSCPSLCQLRVLESKGFNDSHILRIEPAILNQLSEINLHTSNGIGIKSIEFIKTHSMSLRKLSMSSKGFHHSVSSDVWIDLFSNLTLLNYISIGIDMTDEILNAIADHCPNLVEFYTVLNCINLTMPAITRFVQRPGKLQTSRFMYDNTADDNNDDNDGQYYRFALDYTRTPDGTEPHLRLFDSYDSGHVPVIRNKIVELLYELHDGLDAISIQPDSLLVSDVATAIIAKHAHTFDTLDLHIEYFALSVSEFSLLLKLCTKLRNMRVLSRASFYAKSSLNHCLHALKGTETSIQRLCLSGFKCLTLEMAQEIIQINKQLKEFNLNNCLSQLDMTNLKAYVKENGFSVIVSTNMD